MIKTNPVQTLREQLTERVGKGHLSYSSLKYALGDMRQWEMYMRGELRKESEALYFGSLYDMMLFEPEKAKDTYTVVDEELLCSGIESKSPKLTKEYKTRLANLKELAKQTGNILVPKDDWQRSEGMIHRLRLEGLYDKYLSSGKFQIEFNDDYDGIPLKGFLDCLGDGFIVDSKSTRSMNKFKYDVRSFSYDIQAYIYTKVMGIDKFYWLVQEKNDPYYPGIVRCSDETLFSGEMKFYNALENVQAWLKGDNQIIKGYAEFKV